MLHNSTPVYKRAQQNDKTHQCTTVHASAHIVHNSAPHYILVNSSTYQCKLQYTSALEHTVNYNTVPLHQ